MRAIGPEREEERLLREFFDNLESDNFNRLEEGAKTITQLVTGLYAVLFTILALGDQPAYLTQLSVKWTGSLSIGSFLFALVAALVTLYPWKFVIQENNFSSMQRARLSMLHRKTCGLRFALWFFLAGIGFLGSLIIAILWKL